jgi:hypothetical protein
MFFIYKKISFGSFSDTRACLSDCSQQQARNDCHRLDDFGNGCFKAHFNPYFGQAFPSVKKMPINIYLGGIAAFT